MLDERSKNYLEKIKKNIGFVRMNVSWTSVKDILESNKVEYTTHERKYAICVNHYLVNYNCNVYQYQRGKQNYTAVEFVDTCPPDDYVIISYIFSCRPSANDVLTASIVNEIMSYLKVGFIEPTFECWECGREMHWLDIVVEGEGGNSLMRHYEQLIDRYCGC